MTVEKCIDGCAAAGFSSAGVEFGRECYCGNISYPPSQSYLMSECNMPCTGDASKSCGGDARVLIYYNPPIKTYHGILIANDLNGQYLGHISKHPSVDGHYVYGTDDDALHVTFDGPDWGVLVEGIELQTEDSDVTTYPFLGLVQGHDNTSNDLASGSAQYAELTSTNTVAAGSPAQNVGNSYSDAATLARTSQSHVWNIQLGSGNADLTWINDDSSLATVQMFGQNNVVYISGDSAAYNTVHTDAITPLRLTFMESF
ncbi:hypothetical protein CPB86DRAFT_70642 [Serendipita vermifera]|nr:hypothetical protein CPB86DRAFT_70642 [Serendipita vermifera]